MISLYPDQSELIERVAQSFRQHRNIILYAPTGSGKTVMAGEIMRRLHNKGGRAIVLAHREELIRQFWTTLCAAGLGDDVGLVTAGRPEESWHRHHLCSVQTLARRLAKTRLAPTLLITDEAHHASAATYRRIQQRWPDIPHLGLTATPARTDGKGLGGIFNEIVQGLGVRELIAMGRLAPYRALSLDAGISGGEARTARGDYRPDDLARMIVEGEAIANVEQIIRQHCRGRRWLAFGPAIAISIDLAERLRKRGVRCEHIDGTLPRPERRAILQRFAEGKIDGLCSVDLVSEGFDCPAADTAVMYRRTKSLIVYLQQVGRALRYEPGKTALILDCCGNMLNENHGLPCAPRQWTLEGEGRKSRSKAAPSVAICEHCHTAMPITQYTCPTCGRARHRPRPQPAEVNIKLVEVELPGGAVSARIEVKPSGALDGKQVRRIARQVFAEAGEDGVRSLEGKLGYRPGWADHQLQWLPKTLRR